MLRPHVSVSGYFCTFRAPVHNLLAFLLIINVSFAKLSPKWVFLKTPDSRMRVDGENGVFLKRLLHIFAVALMICECHNYHVNHVS